VSDEALRDLERAGRDDPAARARWLLARVRAGTLSQQRLALASACGDAGAIRAVHRTTGFTVAELLHALAGALDHLDMARALVVIARAGFATYPDAQEASRDLLEATDGALTSGDGDALHALASRATREVDGAYLAERQRGGLIHLACAPAPTAVNVEATLHRAHVVHALDTWIPRAIKPARAALAGWLLL
jgi:hypothetical protein